MKWFYIFSGFLLAPIMGSVAAFIVGVLGGMPLEYAFPFVPIAAVIGYAGEIVVGLPLLAVGYWLSYVRLPLFLAGGVLGALAFWSIYYFNQDPIPFLDFLAMVLELLPEN